MSRFGCSVLSSGPPPRPTPARRRFGWREGGGPPSTGSTGSTAGTRTRSTYWPRTRTSGTGSTTRAPNSSIQRYNLSCQTAPQSVGRRIEKIVRFSPSPLAPDIGFQFIQLNYIKWVYKKCQTLILFVKWAQGGGIFF